MSAHYVKKITDKTRGFTIVELLIVIVVIAILATITIVAYTGISQRAASAVLESDLKNAASQLGSYNVELGTYPASLSLLNDGTGAKKSEGTDYQYTYTAGTNSYCVTATSTRAGSNSFRFDSAVGAVELGVCSGHIAGGAVDNHDNVTTYAGSTLGYVNATGTAARFGAPNGVTITSTGTMYVADGGNHAIRAISPAGVVTLYAGDPYTSGVSNGSGTSTAGVTFTNPDTITVDGSNNLYIGDNYRIRKINTATGATITLAGNNTGYVDASGSTARFAGVTQIAVNSVGDLYAADPNNNRIRKITAAGVVTTFAGAGSGYLDGTGTAALFSSPRGIAINSNGDIYVADSFNNRIRKITPAGVVTTFAGSTVGSTNGTGVAAKFSTPHNLVFDAADNLYVSETGNDLIRKITPAGVVTTLAGSTAGYADGIGAAASFNNPAGMFVTSSGQLYVVDSNNNRIRLIQ